MDDCVGELTAWRTSDPVAPARRLGARSSIADGRWSIPGSLLDPAAGARRAHAGDESVVREGATEVAKRIRERDSTAAGGP